jgi:hypothetical protein
MADVYYDGRPNDQSSFPGLFELPVASLKQKLGDVSQQSVIPFLGAGASLPAGRSAALDPPKNRPTEEQLDQVCTSFGITESWSRRFLEVAIQLAQLLDQKSKLEYPEDPARAPSSWQLAQRIAQTVALEPYRPIGDNVKKLLQERPARDDYADIIRDAADILGLSHAVPQLLTVASFFSAQDQRRQLFTNLDERFRSVKQVTEIQKTIAARAKSFVSARNGNPDSTDKADYIILTTNYDQLMESWLAEQEVPTCVVTVDRKLKIRTRFMENVPDLLRLNASQFSSLEKRYQENKFSDPLAPGEFTLNEKDCSLALVYKIHGCPFIDAKQLIDARQRIDNLVISDHDYVLFIQKNGSQNSLIPAYISDRIVESSFLFLGYSFSDWNVRSLYQQIIRLRHQQQFNGSHPDAETDEDPDYIVMRTYRESEYHLFNKWRVSILVTDLDQLARKLS